MEVSNETPVKKSKRLTSVVWNHFEKVKKADIYYAVCVHCQKKLSGSSNSGTTHLRNHLIRCLKRSSYDVSHILSAKRKRKEPIVTIASVNYDGAQENGESIMPIAYMFDQEQEKDETVNLGSVNFDQERSRLDLARMIMLHGYPLSMVEHIGFKIFVKNLQPSFEVMTNSAIELECMKIYMKERQKVFDMIHNMHRRISIGVSMWSSTENVGYLCLTANYIDMDWKLQKKILNFVKLDSSCTDDVLSNVVINGLMDWDIDHKLFSITFDDCFPNDNIAFRIKVSLSQSRPILKNGELFDLRCAAQLIKSLVQEAMESLQDVTHKIRASVIYVKSSQATLIKFNEIAEKVGIISEKHLCLDCPMRWNSTYLMLETALEYKGAFSVLQEHNSAYTMCLCEEEWEWVSALTDFMKLFVEVTNVFTGSKHPTANIYFPEICDVHIQLIEWCKSPDDFISSIAMKMKTKFDKYWSKCSLGLAIAAILDPRFKMKLVEYYYPKIYNNDAPDRIKAVSNGIRELFNGYSKGSTSAQPGSSLPSTKNGTRDRVDRLIGFDKFLHETSQSRTITSDLDKYLEEPIFPRNYNFNILNWWKVHTPRYPVLSVMARDVLGIPVSTLTMDFAFKTGGRVLDNHRVLHNPDLQQAMICGQDWLQMDSQGMRFFNWASYICVSFILFVTTIFFFLFQIQIRHLAIPGYPLSSK